MAVLVFQDCKSYIIQRYSESHLNLRLFYDIIPSMKSILIKDTTREEREQIVADSLGEDYSVGCGFDDTGIDYQLYIDGKKELRELNAEARCGFEKAHPDSLEESRSCPV